MSDSKECVVAAYEGGALADAAECAVGMGVTKFMGPCDRLDAVLACWDSWNGSKGSQNPICGP